MAVSPNIIHTHFAVPAGALAFVLSKLTGVPYILTAHLGDVPDGVPEKTAHWFRWLKPFTKPIWQNAKKVIAVSEFTRQLALKHYPVEICVIPNGADVSYMVSNTIEVNTPPPYCLCRKTCFAKEPISDHSSAFYP
ncbi:MAG: glycosyltransferase [Anaerolineales bacterium]|nr:glycosyltransferase [Anaerolineales bacterium]